MRRNRPPPRRQPEHDSSEEPLISKKWSGLAAAMLATLGSVLLWAASQVIELDTRIDKLESAAERLIDPNTGQSRPTVQALEAFMQVESLQEQVNRIWDRLQQIEDRFLNLQSGGKD